ncbi:MAG: hypothetical protein JNM01_19345 [Delftia acidovorans]|nr:hypothetical protein [Delftia acidovorans]
MTSKIIAEIREKYLGSLQDMQTTTELLLDILNQAQAQHPGLLESFQPFSPADQLDHNADTWNVEYFYAQKGRANFNFARQRIEHLLQVRDHLQRKGVKGFVPEVCQPLSVPQKEELVNSSYIPSENLHSFLEEGDLATIRTALRLELNDNRLTAADLRAALAWTKDRVNALLDTYSEKSFARGLETDPQLWTSQYYEQQVVYLKTNFAEERFLHLIEVREQLRQQGVEGFAALPPKPRAQRPNLNQASSQNPSSQQSGRDQAGDRTPPPLSAEHPAVKTALLIGGAVAALVALLVALVVR